MRCLPRRNQQALGINDHLYGCLCDDCRDAIRAGNRECADEISRRLAVFQLVESWFLRKMGRVSEDEYFAGSSDLSMGDGWIATGVLIKG